MEMTITNYRRRRRFGWGYSSIPTGESLSLEIPAGPTYEGTLNQLDEARDTDRIFQTHSKSAIYNTAWFYEGKRILATWCYGAMEPTVTPYGEWIDSVSYGYRWQDGFHPDPDDDDIEVRLEGEE